MSFDPNTSLIILSALGWSINRRAEVETALTTAEADAVLEQFIKDKLAELTALCQQSASNVASGQGALIQADVLKWDVAMRSEAELVLKQNLIAEIANLLGLEWSPIISCPAGTIVIDFEAT